MKINFFLILALVWTSCSSTRFPIPHLTMADEPMTPNQTRGSWAEAWKYSLESPSFGTLACGEDKIALLNEEGTLHVLDYAGHRLWTVNLGKSPCADPLWSGETLLVATESILSAYEGSTGKKLWEAAPGKMSTILWAGDGKVILPTLEGQLVALNLLNGTVLWSVDAGPSPQPEPWTFRNGGVAIYQNLVYLMDGSSTVRAWDVDTGELKWTSGPWKTTGSRTPGLWTLKMTENGLVGFLNRREGVRLNSLNGGLLDRFTLPRPLGTDFTFENSILYLPLRAPGKHVLAWDLNGNKLLWNETMPLSGGSWMNVIALDGDWLWVGGSDSKSLYLLNKKTGDLVNKLILKSRFWSPPQRKDNLLITLTEDGIVRGFHLTNQ